MRHKLARQIRSYHFDMELVEMKIYPNGLHCLFNPFVCAEIPLAGSHKYLPCGILEAEYHSSNNTRHTENAKKHLAEHFKVSAKCQQVAVIYKLIFLRL